MRIDVHHGVHQAHLFPTGAKLKQLLALVFIVPFLAVFGPVFVAVGSTGVHVRCEHQGDVVNCTVRRTVLFGLVGLTDQATDVSGVRVSTPASTTHRRRRALVTAVQLTTASGNVPLTLGASNTNYDEKRRLADAVSTFLDSPAVRRLDLRQSFSNVFLLFGIPFTALWLAVLWGALRWPMWLLFPPRWELDEVRRVLSLRPRVGRPGMRSIPFAEVAKVILTRNDGGWMGARMDQPASHPRASSHQRKTGRPARSHLHLRVELTGGDSVLVRNVARLGDAEMRQLADLAVRLTGTKLELTAGARAGLGLEGE